jgi:hypothetical protein
VNTGAGRAIITGGNKGSQLLGPTRESIWALATWQPITPTVVIRRFSIDSTAKP